VPNSAPQERTEAVGTGERAEKPTWQILLPRLLLLLVIVAITLVILLNREQLRHFAAYGYPGVFVISLLGSATIIVPAPSIAVVFAMGAVLNPFLIGPVAGLGEALGELTGYLAGATGRAVIEDKGFYHKMAAWTQRYGLILIFVLSAVPNPVFDVAGIAAGALKIPLWQFLVVCFLGKTVKATVVALLGAGALAILDP